MDGVGAHEIIVETPATGQPLETLPLDDIAEVFKTFKMRMVDLEKDMRFRYLLVFKNVGRMAGASLGHAHSQLIATPVIPSIVQNKLDHARAYYLDKERSIFEDMLQQELRDNQRIVYQNSGFVAFCPYASRFPFEISIVPRRQMSDFHDAEKNDFLQIADCYKVVIQKLNKALNHPHYNCLLYTAPTRSSTAARLDGLERYFRWHLEIIPRVTMVTGFEVGSGFYINPVPPEAAAQFMQDVQV
jgi:UDPglucose--hexose-1-phosphate uridylyltransferase